MIHWMYCYFPTLPSRVLKDYILGSLLRPAVMVSGSSLSRCSITWARTWHCKHPVVACYTCPSKLSKFIEIISWSSKCAVCEIAVWSSVLLDTQCIANWAVLKAIMGKWRWEIVEQVAQKGSARLIPGHIWGEAERAFWATLPSWRCAWLFQGGWN